MEIIRDTLYGTMMPLYSKGDDEIYLFSMANGVPTITSKIDNDINFLINLVEKKFLTPISEEQIIKIFENLSCDMVIIANRTQWYDKRNCFKKLRKPLNEIGYAGIKYN